MDNEVREWMKRNWRYHIDDQNAFNPTEAAHACAQELYDRPAEAAEFEAADETHHELLAAGMCNG